MTGFAKNKVELGKLVELSRASLQRYFELPGHPKPRADGRHDVEAWRAFIQAHRSAPNYASNGNGARYEPTPREKALTERAAIEAQRARFRLMVEVGEYLPRQDVCFQVETAHSTVRRELNKKLLHEMPPRLEGLKAGEMKRPLRKLIDALSDHLWNEFQTLAVGAGGAV
jgi:hypothetical protein